MLDKLSYIFYIAKINQQDTQREIIYKYIRVGLGVGQPVGRGDGLGVGRHVG